MDRSVDSIGSCSLDVDADSTDFSDTSGELNFLTPISGKDITREFTAGIKERCMLPVINCQAVTSVLDPVTGHISTVLTTTASANSQQQAPPSNSLLQPLLSGGDSSPPAATNKKPSYLNLACCVNGYSNLTTYDSKLRQDINKSREVSPSRPIIATLHYNRSDSGTGGHLLTAPTLSYVSMNNTINNNYSAGGPGGLGGNRTLRMNGTTGVGNGALSGRIRGMNGTVVSPPSSADVTDNASGMGLFNGNGGFMGGLRTKVISSQSQISCHTREDAQSQLMTPKKSFIQQRVEKLYGASDVVVLNKQNYSSSERKYLNNIANENGTNGGTPVKTMHHGMPGQQQPIGNGTARNGVANGGLYTANGTNGSSFVPAEQKNRHSNGEGHEGEEADVDSLPVLRHLRPEFRAQLQIFSPKKIPKPAPNRVAANTFNGNGNVAHTNGNSPPLEEGANLYTASKCHSRANGNSYAEGQQHDHRQPLNGDGSNRSTVSIKSSRKSSYTTTTSMISSVETSNGLHHDLRGDEEALSTSSRHHSNASVRTITIESNEREQREQKHHPHEAAESNLSSSTTSPFAPGTAVVEEKMRSLVVVPSATPDHVGVGRLTNAADSMCAIATVNVPDVPNPATVATSAIVNGEQNGARNSGGLETGVQAFSVTKSHVADRNGGGGEPVNCDSSIELVADSMRTSNGGESSAVMDSASVITLPTTMAGDQMPGDGCFAKVPPAACTEPATNGISSSSSSSASNNNNVLDGNYFLRILKNEQHRLEAMADEVENEIKQLKADGVELGEDVNGYILVAVGKARLLCSQKMKQFEDLCYTNLNQSPEEKFQTTGEDLRGFWDMVMLQVNNVDASFVEIDSFRKNGWRKPIPQSPPPAQARNGTALRTKLVKRPYKTQTGGSNGGSTVTDGSNGVEAKKASAALAAAKREAQRKQLMEMKRKQKLANSQQLAAVEIFAPSSEESTQNGEDNRSCPAAVVTASSALVDTS